MSNKVIKERYNFYMQFEEVYKGSESPSKQTGLTIKQRGAGREDIVFVGADDMATLYLAMKKYYTEREYLL